MMIFRVLQWHYFFNIKLSGVINSKKNKGKILNNFQSRKPFSYIFEKYYGVKHFFSIFAKNMSAVTNKAEMLSNKSILNAFWGIVSISIYFFLKKYFDCKSQWNYICKHVKCFFMIKRHFTNIL